MIVRISTEMVQPFLNMIEDEDIEVLSIDMEGERAVVLELDCSAIDLWDTFKMLFDFMKEVEDD